MHNGSLLFRSALERNPRSYVAGLDVSLTSTGFYLKSLDPSEDLPDWHYYLPTEKKTGTDAARVDYIADTILEDLLNPQYPVIAVCIEDYGPISKFAGKLLVRAETVGCIKRGLRHAGIPYYTASPLGLKKFATGYGGTRKGEKLKEAVIIAANEHGFDTRVSDEADAYWLAHLMEAIVKNDPHGIDVIRTNPVGFTFDKKH